MPAMKLTQKISLLISVVNEWCCYPILLNFFTKLKKVLENAQIDSDGTGTHIIMPCMQLLISGTCGSIAIQTLSKLALQLQVILEEDFTVPVQSNYSS